MPKAKVTTTVLVAGGTGFVGSRLVPRLLAEGHRVRVLTRSPSGRDDSAIEVVGDVNVADTLDAALDGVDLAFYLVHSLGRGDFETTDREGARNFAQAAKRAGVTRVVYLGGLGREADDLSPHLRSRREVEHILSEHIETVALRAAVIVGQGSTSWEILCQLVERLPVMITPRWVNTPTQPIALDDVVEYLVRCLDRAVVPAGHYDVGAPDATTYRDMMATVARLMRRTLVVMPVPVLSPGLSARWLRLVTNVDMTTARALVESLVNTAEVTERELESLTGHRAMPFVDAASHALAERITAAALSLSA
ncbi:MAG: NAD(P)H-binding protein [Acidimicrobiales bacterium]